MNEVIGNIRVISNDDIVEVFLKAVKERAAESKPDECGIEGLTIEFADTVAAIRSDIGNRICRQCINLAAECLRKYSKHWTKGKPMNVVST